jgi:hypothetical protein
MYNPDLGLVHTLVEYFEWHREQISHLDPTNWKHKKYLILRCVREDIKCGGLSDRLKPLPLLIAVAAQSKRIFLIRWEVPARLEEFLVPNQLNWSVPIWMQPHLQAMSRSRRTSNPDRQLLVTNGAQDMANRRRRAKVIVWEALVQDLYGGSGVYRNIVTDTVNATRWNGEVGGVFYNGWDLYQSVYHDLFRALFSPSEPVAALVQEKMDSAQLKPGMYAMAHYRAFYAIEGKKELRSNSTLSRYAVHAVECAASLRPGVPVYFASDSKKAVDTVRNYAQGGANRNITVVTFASDETEEEALHIGKVHDWESRPPSDFYPTFVDLLLMANGRCLAYGQGGFGQYAALLSYDASCTIRHSVPRRLLPCPGKVDAEPPASSARLNRRRRRIRRKNSNDTHAKD